jgi:two-component system OmpR family response regulator
MRIAILTAPGTEADFLTLHLEAENYECHVFQREQELYTVALHCPFELLILGSMTDEMNLVELAAQVRVELPDDLPVLVCSTRDVTPDLLRRSGLDADAALCLPMTPEVLLARIGSIRAGIGKTANSGAGESFGRYRFDPSERGVYISDDFIGLTRKQYGFSLLLFRNMSRPVSISHIRQVVWNQQAALVSRTIDSHASTIRAKLNLRPHNGYILSSVYRFGYLLEQVSAPGFFANRGDDLR